MNRKKILTLDNLDHAVAGALNLSATIVLAVVFTYSLLFMLSRNESTQGCLAAGYSSARTTVALERYCVRHSAQGEQVVPYHSRWHPHD